jgi:hypothetical protein
MRKSFETTLNQLPWDDRLRAAVYAMNTLLIAKGIYSQEEFQKLLVEWTSRDRPKSSQIRIGMIT